jgi:hypothetical protein
MEKGKSMNPCQRFLVNILIVSLLLGFTLTLAAQDTHSSPVITVRNVVRTSSEKQIPGAEAILTRMEHGISMSLVTEELEPGYAYTIWWVIFNMPKNCSDAICGLNDVFLMDAEERFILDGSGLVQPNIAGREATQVSFLWATGNIADENGHAMFRASLPIGDLTGDVSFGPGLLDSMRSEVHLILRSHGPVIPELRDEQLFTAWGGCPDPVTRAPCEDVQIAIFEPPAA